MPRVHRLALAAAAAGWLSACAALEPPPDDHYYRLDVIAPTERFAAPPFAGTLEVAPFTATGLVADRAIVFTVPDQPFEVDSYNYHLWNEPPGVLLQEQLIRFLREANLADRVVSPELRLPADYAVEGRIRRFDQVVAGGARMQIELELALIRLADEAPLLLRTYTVEEPAPNESVPAAVLATNKGLSEIYSRFLADIRALRPRA